MGIHDLTTYRKAKIIVADIKEIRQILKDTYKKLVKYKKYIPIKNVLNEILNAEIVLKCFNEKQIEIVQSKAGEKHEEA
jgi:hypothetical protein